MATTREIRRILSERILAPKKWMGQNLLVDRNYLLRIVDAAGIKAGEPVVEVGAGLGVLTEELLARGAKVYALEIDSGFFRFLQERLGASPAVELIHADALKYDFETLAARIGRLKVVANLPYSISSRLLFLVCHNSELFTSLHILLQKEVAERLTAVPGTKEYGVLTVLLGIRATVRILSNIPPKAFYPPPEVISTLVHISLPEVPPRLVADSRLLTRLVKASFAGRRKTLRNTLKSAVIPGISLQVLASAAQDADIDLARRGETLSPTEFARFADAVHALARQCQ